MGAADEQAIADYAFLSFIAYFISRACSTTPPVKAR